MSLKPGTTYAEALSNNSNKSLALVASTRKGDDPLWIIDSGATDHMVSSDSFLKQVKRSSTPVRIANNAVILTEGVGTLQCTGSGGQQIEMKNVWLVPELKKNLLSVAAIDKSGHQVIFGNGRVSIERRNGSVIAQGRLDKESGLYKMDLEFVGKEAHLSVKGSDANLWHRRLGHLNFHDLKRMGLDLTGEEKFCESCQLGKAKRLPFKKHKFKTSEALSILNIDLCGPMETTGRDGEKYFLAVTDEATDYTVVELLKSKEKEPICDFLTRYVAMMETQVGRNVKKIRCDGGGEFINNLLEDFCGQKGIILDSSNPHTPEQNGVSERKNRTLVEMARTMFKDAKLKNEFWPDAILTSAYVRNRCGRRGFSKTAVERMMGKKPNFENMKVFGCQAFVHIPDANRKKLDPKANKCILIGYSTNGYKLVRLEAKEGSVE